MLCMIIVVCFSVYKYDLLPDVRQKSCPTTQRPHLYHSNKKEINQNQNNQTTTTTNLRRRVVEPSKHCESVIYWLIVRDNQSPSLHSTTMLKIQIVTKKSQKFRIFDWFFGYDQRCDRQLFVWNSTRLAIVLRNHRQCPTTIAPIHRLLLDVCKFQSYELETYNNNNNNNNNKIVLLEDQDQHPNAIQQLYLNDE
jgi:hypothetical protein